MCLRYFDNAFQKFLLYLIPSIISINMEGGLVANTLFRNPSLTLYRSLDYYHANH